MKRFSTGIILRFTASFGPTLMNSSCESVRSPARLAASLRAAVLFLVLTMTVLPHPSASAAALENQVKVSGGTIEGVWDGKTEVRSFKGIPFAAPPLGDLRWRAPQPVKPWEGVRKADAFAPGPMQNALFAIAMGGTTNLSEDCLYLNLWTPAKHDDDRLPVMVWIYGGAFVSGLTSLPIYDGTRLAQKQVVLVTLAYREGAFGFLAHPDLSRESGRGSGCYGLQDQVAALKWIKDNIARFGGDPGRVTIFGESAGGISASMLTIVPAAKGLFHRAISQSGGSMAPIKHGNAPGESIPALVLAEKAGVRFLENLGAKDLTAARALDAGRIQGASGGMGSFWPVADGETIPGDANELFQNGRFHDTPILIGSNSDEGAMFVQSGATPESFETQIKSSYGPAADSILANYPHASKTECFKSSKDVFRELYFAWPTWKWAQLQSTHGTGKAYVYYFNRHGPGSPDGASHAAEIGYVFRNLGGWGGSSEPRDVELSDLMSSYWVNFATTGNPNAPGLPIWPAFDAKNAQAMVFGTKPTARPYPNLDKVKSFDEYFAWRRGQLSSPGLKTNE